MKHIQGVILAVSAFIVWGMTPLFYSNCSSENILHLLLYRTIGAIPFLLIVRLFISPEIQLKTLLKDKTSFLLCAINGIIMCISWLTFVYALTHHEVMDASLGYFINPLLLIFFGQVFLHEHLNFFQKIIIRLAVCVFFILTIMSGEVPILAISMGVSFAFYSLIRKFIRYDLITSILLETVMVLPLILPVILVCSPSAYMADINIWVLFIAPVTYIPVILLAAALQKTTLAVIGLAQYTEPTIQFLLAVTVFNENAGLLEISYFIIIWLGLAGCICEPIIRNKFIQK
ncbi:EamA family transporter RarD [Salmonella enterica]|nr:EamA family transporter RarD [Salmonella enterica]EEJ8659323.1 EamA family transporter [Salmonella enterica subsp. enterica]